jgi:uncharacterized protein with HEPN domain
MSKERDDSDYLADIQEAIEKIQQYIAGYTFPRFVQDSKTQDAVIRNLEIIGEATKQISTPLKETYSDVPWKSLAGVRDRLIHHYFGVNYETVWQIITLELPQIAPRVREALEK